MCLLNHPSTLKTFHANTDRVGGLPLGAMVPNRSSSSLKRPGEARSSSLVWAQKESSLSFWGWMTVQWIFFIGCPGFRFALGWRKAGSGGGPRGPRPSPGGGGGPMPPSGGGGGGGGPGPPSPQAPPSSFPVFSSQDNSTQPRRSVPGMPIHPTFRKNLGMQKQRRNREAAEAATGAPLSGPEKRAVAAGAAGAAGDREEKAAGVPWKVHASLCPDRGALECRVQSCAMDIKLKDALESTQSWLVGAGRHTFDQFNRIESIGQSVQSTPTKLSCQDVLSSVVPGGGGGGGGGGAAVPLRLPRLGGGGGGGGGGAAVPGAKGSGGPEGSSAGALRLSFVGSGSGPFFSICKYHPIEKRTLKRAEWERELSGRPSPFGSW